MPQASVTRRSVAPGQAGGGSSVNAQAIAQRAVANWQPRAATASVVLLPATVNPAPMGAITSIWSIGPTAGSVVLVNDFGESIQITRLNTNDADLMSYAAVRAWGAEDRYLLVNGRIYDGQWPHAVVRSSFSFGGFNVNFPQWDGTDPDRMFGLHQSAAWIRDYRPSTNASTLLRDFAPLGYDQVWGGDSSSIGDDGWFFLKGHKTQAATGTTGGEWWILWYNVYTNTVGAQMKLLHPITGRNLQPKNTHTSRSGAVGILTYGFVADTTNQELAMYQYDRDLNRVRTLYGSGSTDATPHAAPGRVAGVDVLVAFPGRVTSLVTGGHTDVTPGAGTWAVQHISADGDDWGCFASGAMSPGSSDASLATYRGGDIAGMLKLDGSGDYRPFVRMHGVAIEGSTYQSDVMDPYPHASRAGNMIAFKTRLRNPSVAGSSGPIVVARRVA